MSKYVTYVDPPCGWQYGFPKPLPPDDVDMEQWFLDNGYPANMLGLAMEHSRYWQEEVVESHGLNAYRDELHLLSRLAGWWPQHPHSLELYATKVALLHSEVSEMLEGLRKGEPDKHLPHRSAEEVEAADILIRLFDYAGARGLDLEGAVREKLEYNKKRSDHKQSARQSDGGKKF